MAGKWDELTKLEKILRSIGGVIAALVVIWGFAWGGYTHFATRAYADEQHKKIKNEQAQAFNRLAIVQAQTQIDQIELQLLDETISNEKQALLKAQKEKQEKLIACIQERKELCY